MQSSIRIVLYVTSLLAFFYFALSSRITDIAPSTRQISPDVFTCDSSDELLKAVCQIGLNKINGELEASGVIVNRDGILFTWEDPKDVKIKTGHSCTVTAKVTNQKVTARITNEASLKFSGDSLSEPFAIRLQLPVVVTGRIDVKQRFGTRILGSCSNTGSDSFAFKASLGTTADAMVGLYFNPSFGLLDSGDFGLVIEPKVTVVSQLRDTKFQFRISGVSPLTPIVQFVTGFGSTFFKSVTAIFTGESIGKIIESAAGFDLLVPIGLGIGALPRPLEAVIWDRIFRINEHQVLKKSMGFGDDIEEKLQGDLARALKLQPDGKRVFIIKKDVVDLFRSSGVGADVFVEQPVSPSVACEARARQVCSSSDLQVIFNECVPLRQECQRLLREHLAKYSPASAIVAKPKVASLPPPPTTPPPTTRPPTTRPPFTTECITRPGQEIDC